MDYKEKYKNALANARQEYNTTENVERKQWLEELFPELNESEDDRMRKEIIEHIKANKCADYVLFKKFLPDNVIAWLEKQGIKPQGKTALEVWKGMRLEVYQQASGNRHEPNYSDDSTKMFSLNDIDEIIEKISEQKADNANKIKPKFKNGQWIVWQDKCYKVNYNGCGYELIDQNGLSTSLEYGTVEQSARLWYIKDAKDGDVLFIEVDGSICIFKKLEVNSLYSYIISDGKLLVEDSHYYYETSDNIHPATKEQRELLFSKMKEAGYKWDDEHKELKKIETVNIPFSAKDSELMEATYFIPKGFHAEIVDNKVIIKKSEQKPALSEEDNTKLRQIEYACMKFFGGDCSHVDWLRKFTKPQTTWKPTEEQMQALNEAVGIVGLFTPRGSYLKSLSEQLKKLKEK